MEKITSEEFIDKFVECLEKGEDFRLENCIVEGDVDILKIYERIKERIRGEERLKELIEESNEKIIINVDINITFHNVEFNGNFLMCYMTEPQKTLKTLGIRFNSVYFKNSTFKGVVDFSNVVFNGDFNFSVTFERDVSFNKAVFKKEVDFSNTTFGGNVNFEDAIFEKTAIFTNIIGGLIFKGNANFKNAKFKEDVSFNNATFEKDVDFSNAIFEGDASFSGIIGGPTFNGDANFNNVIFKKDVVFHYATFNGDAYFNNAVFEGDVDFSGIIKCKLALNEDSNGKIFKEWIEYILSERRVVFEGYVGFNNSIFKKDAYFSAIFKEKVDFINSTFEGKVNFTGSIFNRVEFYHTTFNSHADFRNICFRLLLFADCIFEDVALFKKDEIKFERRINQYIDSLKIPDIQKEFRRDKIICQIEICRELDILKNENLAIFLNTQFLNKHTKIENFPLSKTSFLRTDVREVMILCNIKKEEILSHKLLKIKENRKDKDKKLENELKELLDIEYDEIINQFNYESVLAEYRNLRISIENNRTYVEASNLYKMEMELIKETSFKKLNEKISKSKLKIMAIIFAIFVLFIGLLYTILIITIIFAVILLKNKNEMEDYKIIFEGIIIYLYGFLSDYGESILKPVIISAVLIYLFPILVPILDFNGLLFEVKPLNIDNLLNYLANIPKYYYDSIILNYNTHLKQTLRAFFQLRIDKDVINLTNNTLQKEQLQTLVSYEWLIRIISLILLGNIFIAIKRRLERK